MRSELNVMRWLFYTFPTIYIFDIVQEVSKDIGARVQIVRGAPRWMVMQGARTDLELAIGKCQNLLRTNNSLQEINTWANNQCVAAC